MFDHVISKVSSSGLRLLSLKTKKRRLSILIYHRVLASPDPHRPTEVDKKAFLWQMNLLSKNYNVLPFSVAVKHIVDGSLPPNALCITFDDGYADNHDVALPILQKFGFCATFFIATGFLNGGQMWNDHIIDAISNVTDKSIDIPEYEIGKLDTHSIVERNHSINHILQRAKYLEHDERKKLAQNIYDKYVSKSCSLMMTDQQVINLKQSNMEIGGHTITHPILANMSGSDAYSEIKGGKDYLENLLDSPVDIFAYPNGKQQTDYNSESISAVKNAGFTAAVSTEWGVSGKEGDAFQLRRFTPWDQSPAKFSLRLAQNYVAK